jgi:hypothetical protein
MLNFVLIMAKTPASDELNTLLSRSLVCSNTWAFLFEMLTIVTVNLYINPEYID